MSYLQAAFDLVIENNKKPESHYVTLVSSYQAYGGPEEGGWWYTVSELVAYKEFPSIELAEAAREAVEKMAMELQADARREHGEKCLAEMEWLDARGLDADWLPEPDGEDTFSVNITTELPEFNNSRPHYE